MNVDQKDTRNQHSGTWREAQGFITLIADEAQLEEDYKKRKLGWEGLQGGAL